MGFDLGKFLKKEEFEFNFSKVEKRFEEVKDLVEELRKKLNKEIKEKEYEFARAVVVIDGKLKEAMVPVLEDMQTLMKDKVRNRANDVLL